MTVVPYRVRIREAPQGQYWLVEEWRPCDCPECEVDAHWMSRAGCTSIDDARIIAKGCAPAWEEMLPL